MSRDSKQCPRFAFKVYDEALVFLEQCLDWIVFFKSFKGKLFSRTHNASDSIVFCFSFMVFLDLDSTRVIQ